MRTCGGHGAASHDGTAAGDGTADLGRREHVEGCVEMKESLPGGAEMESMEWRVWWMDNG